jgi:hypothetical protein
LTPAPERTSAGIESAQQICDAPRAIGFWHLASLDAPTVAVVWSLAFAWAGRVHLPLWMPLLLALASWSVYVVDRLLDARAGLHGPARRALRERHRFHWRHRQALLPMAILAACAAAGIILALMPPMARARDSVLAAAALAYLSGVHSERSAHRPPIRWPRSFPAKEFLVGVLFTGGCALPAWHLPHAFAWPGYGVWTFWIPASYFAALAWLNCSAIAHWEATVKPRATRFANPQQPHRNREPEPSAIFFMGASLACGGLALAVAGASMHPRSAALLACGSVSALLLALLDRSRAQFTAIALRAAADLVLLTPLLLLPFAWALR